MRAGGQGMFANVLQGLHKPGPFKRVQGWWMGKREDGGWVIQILFFSFSSSESLLCTFHQSTVLSPGLSGISCLTPLLSIHLASGSSPAVWAQGIHTVLRGVSAGKPCQAQFPIHLNGVSGPELQHRVWPGSPLSTQRAGYTNPESPLWLQYCFFSHSASTRFSLICFCVILEKKTSAEWDVRGRRPGLCLCTAAIS